MSTMRAHDPGSPTGVGRPSAADEEGQCVPRSRPVSFYDNFKEVSIMPPCVTSAVSVGNLNQVRESSSSSMPQNNRVSCAVSAGNVAKIHNLKVTGAVSTGNIGWIFRPEKEKELGRAPSMANYLSTTVPINLAASQIAGRHTPTRNSLRHSRMIVMHRMGNFPRKSQPPLLRHKRLARALAALQTILGLAVTSLSLWLLIWAPNLPVTDNPYWSGMPLLMSGSFGLCLLCCFRKEYPGLSRGFCLSSTKVLSVFLSGLATMACVVACVASAMHVARLKGLNCTPADVRNASCACSRQVEPHLASEPVLQYVDLNCPEVSVLTILLIFSAISNGLGAIVAGFYCYLHWSTRDKRPKYTQVRTNAVAGRPIYNPNMNGR